jgi:hypothetical protein
MGAWAELEQASSMSEPSVTLHSGFLIGVDWLRALSRVLRNETTRSRRTIGNLSLGTVT